MVVLGMITLDRECGTITQRTVAAYCHVELYPHEFGRVAAELPSDVLFVCVAGRPNNVRSLVVRPVLWVTQECLSCLLC
jgi:hypothetical protein